MKLLNKKISLILLILLFLTLTSTITIAKPKSTAYQIELIIFKNNNTDDVYKETWPVVNLTIPSNAINLAEYNNAPDNNNNTYQLLPRSQLKNNLVYNKIKNNRRYTAIAHIGWQQPKNEMVSNKIISFNAGDIYDYNNNPLNSVYELSGIVKFSLKKFVHADLNLLLNLPVNLNNNQFEINKNLNNKTSKLQGFLISENRRLKNNELNYFDNPAFSAIMVVSEV